MTHGPGHDVDRVLSRTALYSAISTIHFITFGEPAFSVDALILRPSNS